MQYKLGLPVLQSIKENGVFYLATYTNHSLSQNNDLLQIINSEEYKSKFKEMEIAHPVGVDFEGNVIICDLVDYPHAMVSGTTESGKSTALKCLLVSLLRYAPDKMNLIIVDRGVELPRFDGLPHLSYPVIYKPEDLAYVFLCLKDEMERRNVLRREDESSYLKLPYIVCVIDEFHWFIEEIQSNKRTEKVVEIINDILRFGRNTKIHLILSIYDPKDDIAIIEKGDIPVGLTFQTVNSRKSMNALGGNGADKFSGRGEMNFHYRGKNYHLQGVNMDDNKIDSIVQYIKDNFSDCESPKGEYGFLISGEELDKKKEDTDVFMNFVSGEGNSNKNGDEKEYKFVRVVIWTLSQENISINSIQKECKVSNSYAKEYYEKLESLGVLGEKGEKGRRKVLPQSIKEIPSSLKDILSRYDISDDEITSAISKRIMASEQKKGTELARIVVQDKIEEFLENHDYGENVNKEERDKPLETLSTQNDMEPRQEQDIELNDEETKNKNRDINPAQTDIQRINQALSHMVRNHSNRKNFKKKPAR